jgi:hypothetical protein
MLHFVSSHNSLRQAVYNMNYILHFITTKKAFTFDQSYFLYKVFKCEMSLVVSSRFDER